MVDNFSEAKYKRTDVYLENRYEKPKHMFVVIADKISHLTSPHLKINNSLLDVGGATGEFGYYLLKRFPNLKVTVLEYDKELYELGRVNNKKITFINSDANNMDIFNNKEFDIVTFIGTMNIFDDFTSSLNECIRVCKDGGNIIVVSPFNEFPVDILIRWKYSGEDVYNPGYNTFSKKTVSDFLCANPKVFAFNFEKFTLPFDLPKQTDVIRTWTEIDKKYGNRVFKNAIGEINLQILTINLKQ